MLTAQELRILESGRKYGACVTRELGVNGRVKQETTPLNSLTWNNPENIDSGNSGLILFLIELFEYDKDQSRLEVIQTAVRELILHCRNNPTHNYSLYTGRCGVVYVLIRLYQINNDYTLLKEALSMILPVNQEYLNSEYTSDYLYNGRAGTLLVIFYLYLVTEEEFLLKFIDEFIQKIISSASFSGDTMYWQNVEEINLRPSCGFGYGTSGIGYVFNLLNTCFPNAGLAFILDKINRYKDSCWVKDFESWGDFSKDIFNKETLENYKKAFSEKKAEYILQPKDNISWAHGAAGTAISGIMEYSRGVNGEYGIVNRKLISGCLSEREMPANLYEGLAGLGIYFLEAYRRSNEDIFQKCIFKIADQWLDGTVEPGLDGGLFHSDLGMVYFLIQAINIHNSNESILFPLLNSKLVDNRLKATLAINLPTTRKMLLSKHFGRTIDWLDVVAPKVLAKFLDECTDVDQEGGMIGFIGFIENNILSRLDIPIHEIIKDVFHLEKERLLYLISEKRSFFQFYFEGLLHHDNVIRRLNNPDEWLLQKVLFISQEIRIVSSRWNWVLQESLKPTHNLFNTPGNVETMLQISNGSIVETSLEMVGLVLHRFDEPKTVGQALMEIRYFCQMQKEDALIEFAQGTASKDVADFLSRLDFLILYKVKELIYGNVLIMKE